MTLVVSGIAACTPVGLHAEATCAALRAGVANLMELGTFAVDGELFDREPMIGGRVPTEWLQGGPAESQWPGHERFGLRPPPPRELRVRPGIERILELVAIAADEVRASAALDQVPADRFDAYLGLNEADPPGPVVEHLSRTLGIPPSRCHVEPSGRASVLGLLHRATADLRERRIDGALVGGVDSLVRTPIAERFDREHRIRSRTAPQGFIPGEAAAFVYVEPLERASHRGRTIYAELTAAGLGAQPAIGAPTADTDAGPSGEKGSGPTARAAAATAGKRDDEPSIGTGLAEALRAVASGAKLASMPLVVCDLNGEHPRAIEWMVACARVLGGLHGELEVWHPAEGTGDVGAAAGALDLVWAAEALRRGYAPRRRVLVWGASEGPLRAAAVLDGRS